ncbi:hypothetical protein HPB47_022259 [Ixodes persulcatus]|uniref:Uncharacterized protein n=1 Tax=Ixodes persulcatus TaxID=34615 RepID=A0AC60QDK2_IXOPE|nr:hypothetical protein HPB47_022259 [Ixodes persulcatus]
MKSAKPAAKSGTEPTCARNPKPPTARSAACNNRPKTTHASRSAHFVARGTLTGDKCHQRLQTPCLLRRRQWEKKLRQDETDRWRRSFKGRQSHRKEQERKRSPSTTRRLGSLSFPRLPGSENHKSRAESREDPRLGRQDSHIRRKQSQSSTPTEVRDAKRPPLEDQANDYCSDGGPASLLKERNSQVITHKHPNPGKNAHLGARHPSEGHNHSLGENSNPPRKRAKEEREPITLEETTIAIARGHALVILGDFNAAHPAWGYAKELIKGRNLWEDAQREGLTLITDPNQPTRQANSVTRDTTPDLAFVRNLDTGNSVEWSKLGRDLGSDHVITAIQVAHVMLQLQHQIVKTEDKASTDCRVIVALDLTKGFDRLRHEAILRSLQNGDIQDRLQEAIDAVEAHAKTLGLSCSPEKSEQLTYQPTRRCRKPKDGPQTHSITLTVGETPVPGVAEFRNGKTIKYLEKTTHQIARLITRIARKRRGMKGKTPLRLVYAFVISRITYVASFLPLKKVEERKINSLIKRAHKQALEIPMCAPNEKFEALSVHNTPEQLIEAQRNAHLERLTKAVTGRHLLDSLRIPHEKTFGDKLSIPADLQKSIHLLEKQLGEDPQVVYTDAATYKQRGNMVSVVTDRSGKVLAACSIRTKHPEEGEELAIALALATTHERKIRATKGPTRLLEMSPTESPRNPAHIPRTTPKIASVLIETCSITTKGKVEPTRLPTPRSPRSKNNAYPNRRLYRHFHPEIHDGRCKHCPDLASLAHMLWKCLSIERQVFINSKGTFIITSKEQWETVLLGENNDIQQWAVQRAEDAARSKYNLAVV